MKKLFITLMLLPLLGLAQTLEDIDYISPFNNGVSSIKRAGQWAFIDQEGQIVVDFRDDLVTTITDNGNYPIFNNDRCLITTEKNGISYFGYIDKSGKTVIKPQFLNATNFKYGKAIVLKVEKEIIGYNDIFEKDVVNYHYFEVVIDVDGIINEYLTKLSIHVAPSVKSNKEIPPSITSKLILNNLVAVKDNKKWAIKNIN